MSRKKLTSRELHLYVKQGRNIEYILNKYELNSEQELYDIIQMVSPCELSFFKKRFAQNDKKQQRINRQATDKVAEKKPLEGDSITPVDTYVSNELIQIPKLTSPMIDMDSLKKQEADLSNWQCELEREHENLVKERTEVFEALKVQKGELENILKKVTEIAAKVEIQQQMYDSITARMEEYNDAIRSTRLDLQELRRKIKELEVISIFIPNDGDIEIEGSSQAPNFDEKEVNELFVRVIKEPEAEGLTVREIKMISKLIIIVRGYMSKGIKPDLYFDSIAVQDYYNRLVGADV